MEHMVGFFAPFLIYLLILALYVVLPGRWVTGYATREGSDEKLRYRLNGLIVLGVMVGIWSLICYLRIIPWNYLYQIRWSSLLGALTIGVVFSALMVHRYAPITPSYWKDFFMGRTENLQVMSGKVDIKMWLYLVGAVMLALHGLSFAAHHWLTFGANASIGIFICTGMLLYFVCDYLIFEEVHLYTYDLFAERIGFKLGWGCLAFYPYFYVIPLWGTVSLLCQGFSWAYYLLAILIFLMGWSLSRGANMQKFFFKRNPNRPFLGIKPQVVTDGKRSLLVNGFWGVSRHVNYLGEILMATGIALAAGQPNHLLPWLYPLYYVALLFPRQIDDDKRCEAKYGNLWKEYTAKVPYRIIPKIY